MIAERPRPTVIVGEPGEVLSALELARDDGRLVAVHDAARMPDGRVRVAAELAVPEAPRRPAWVAPVLAAGVVLAGVATLAVLVWAVVAIVSAAVAWVVAHLPVILGGLAVLVLLVLCAGRGRVHCPGCPR